MKTLLEMAKACFPDGFCRTVGERVVIATSVFLPWHDESVCVTVEPTEGGIVFTDAHSVTDYWEAFDIDPQAHAQALQEVTDQYRLTFDGKVFSRVFAEEGEASFRANAETFLQAVKQLADIRPVSF